MQIPLDKLSTSFSLAKSVFLCDSTLLCFKRLHFLQNVYGFVINGCV